MQVHVFESCGLKLAVDVDSGALHVLDDIGYDVLRLWRQTPPSEIMLRLLAQYPCDMIKRAIDEIALMQADGQLFTDIDYSDAARGNPEGVVKAMCLHVAHDCDLRCGYCFASTGHFAGQRMMMDVDTGKRALEFLMERSLGRDFLEVDFFGGEPTINFDVVKALVAYGRELEARYGKTISFTITTNAYGLSEEMMDFINAEMDNVVLSIDGRRQVHDRMRRTREGEGSYDAVVRGIRELSGRRGERSHYVRGTFTRYNLDFARDVLELADLGFEGVSVEPVVAPGSAPYAITSEHIPVILNQYEELARAYIERMDAGRPFTFFHFMIDLEQGPCAQKRLTGCGAGNEYVAVTPEGDLYPCHQFVGDQAYKMGNVHNRSIDRQMQARFAKNHVLNKAECRECWARFYCSGGCAANAWHFNRDISIPYELGCRMERKRMECALAIHAHMILRKNEPA